MQRASAAAIVLLLAAVAHAEATEAPEGRDPRTALTSQVQAELETLDKTLATVGDKLSAADLARVRRVRAAYRILRAPLSGDASASDRMASARRRAAARLLLDRDHAESALLANELGQLRSAKDAAVQASARVPSIALPDKLLQPVHGSIARSFGTIIHERSKATLSRRGVDFDVEPGTNVVCPADGTVRYAGPIRGLDHGIVVDHGDYYTILGKLADVAIPVGTKLVRGDRVGHPARQRVYFEVRVKVGPGGLPIDPQPLLARD